MIKIENLTKIYYDGKTAVTALNNVSLHIKKGDIFGIIGMSGAGKTTLLRCLCRLEQPTGGRVVVQGSVLNDLKGKALSSLRAKIGVVFQGYNLQMQRTVEQNVAFPLKIQGASAAQIDDTVTNLLELVGLADKRLSYPAKLSGGQKQRVAIARALAANPSILLCDEPTSALDSLTTRQMLALLQKINVQLGVTIVIITHEMGLVRAITNRVAVIDGAEFVECGETEELFNNPKHEVTKMLLGRV